MNKSTLNMDIGLYTLTSPLHDEKAVDATSAEFISQIEDSLGFQFKFRGPDFSSYGNHDLDVIYVRTGGTESLFEEVFHNLKGNILLLTSGKSNSLAASLEILSYLGQHGRKGEILHGNVDYIVQRLTVLSKVSAAKQVLEGQNLGIIGQPSDWLISSNADEAIVKETIGINLVNIKIEELIELVKSNEDLSSYLPENTVDLTAQIPAGIQKYTEGALRIYCALKRIVEKYELSGFTLRCFDLLSAVDNTGCLALAMLNAEGIPSGCEGDVPTLITMTIGKALTGQCGFQANPSRINPQTGEMLLAHCTIPLDMISSFSFNTHFESGIGLAVHGEMPEGDATIAKFSGDLKRHFCCNAKLTGNPYERSLCRTQITLKVEENPTNVCRDYFLKSPIGNHHVVFIGDQTAIFEAFAETL